MPATQDYTLIQLMRGEKYAVETTIPELGEPLVDLDSGTLYIGNGKDYRGVPVNAGAAFSLKTPCNLDDQITWGKYYVEGKAINLPEGMDLFNKFFLEVEGSKATDPTCIFQTIHIVAGDHQDRTFVRSSNDGGKTWSGWKGIGDGTIKYVTYYNVLPPVPPEDLADGGLIVIR